MKNMIIIFVILLLSISARGSNLLDFGTLNARGMATADSLMAGSGDINNIDRSPASVIGCEKNEFSAGYTKWLDYLNMFRFTYGHAFKDDSVFVTSINYGVIDKFVNYDAYGTVLGSLQDSDFVFTTGYALKLSKQFFVGVDVKYLNMILGPGYTAHWMGMGFSMLASLKAGKNKVFNIVAGIQNLNLLKAKVLKESSGYPVDIYGGCVFISRLNSSLKLVTGVSSTYLTSSHFYLSAGGEMVIKDALFLRVGLPILKRDSDMFSCGMGLRLGGESSMNVIFDYSLSVLDVGLNHYIQVGLVL